MRRRVKVGNHWDGIVYKGQNLIIQLTKKGNEGGTAVFIGNGHSITLDKNDNVVRVDPGMREFHPNIGGEDVTVFAFYFPSFVANLRDAANELAYFIKVSQLTYQNVTLVGHSKAGLCVESTCKYLEQPIDKCITVSTPHAGTITVDEELFSERLNNRLMEYFYRKTFSNHQVDRDILPDSEVIKCVLRPKNCNQHINMISVLELKSAWRNVVDLGCLYLDRRVGMKGDGVVSEVSQRVKWTDNEVVFNCSHARSLQFALWYIDNFLLN